MKDETTAVLLGLLGWLCLALAASLSGYFEHASAIAVAATVWILTALVLLVYWRIWLVFDWVTMVDLRWLIALHLTRFVGIYFLVLSNHGRLPAGFARPAAIGDITIATVAAIILLMSSRRVPRAILLTWNMLGLIDIVYVALSALRFGLKDWESMAPLRELPLSLLPTFFVPLIIASHVLIFLRLKATLA